MQSQAGSRPAQRLLTEELDVFGRELLGAFFREMVPARQDHAADILGDLTHLLVHVGGGGQPFPQLASALTGERVDLSPAAAVL